ncbi:MAG: crossover junction endodeoxyribonuclease RuvC [Dehalococcoidales bacterium]|jgi:crossover junction endodeoxyribonuclease RuvC|nr:crossover junction endodeoxyribonuclease RuvC [Dehalococcoidales bacterium]MDP6576951.1 crossover junction endodeoxyribonuclease RuvC [Dehalococcoidales bacterium]MDP6825272.1 crossover junction endodeoxyribonuclease RuvC [Dehalococcoidales bacterium]|tara:strand:- start:487 stop:990 length:504 start_codon:yes stop_codon:yes gene_type:complete
MKVLGIDPGTVTMGYGVVEGQGDLMSLVDCGVLVSEARSPIGERLDYLYRELLEIVRYHRPGAVAVEQPFVAKNARSALAIGRAQAVALLAATGQGIPTYEYTPTRIKQRVANYGASSKEQVQEMVRLQLDLAEAPQPDDAADAVAVAICHLREEHVSNLLAGQGER